LSSRARVVYHEFCWWRRARVLGGQATQSNFFDHPSSANLEAWSNPKTGSFDLFFAKTLSVAK
jgi:hypothetical protein